MTRTLRSWPMTLVLGKGVPSVDGRLVITYIGALLAVVFQVVLAPNIAIFGIMPSFALVYALVVAFLVPGVHAYLVAFCLGMLSDLLGASPVGALPFILLLAAFAVEYSLKSFDNGTVFVSCVMLVVFVLVAHLLYAAFMVAVTSGYSAASALHVIAIPQALYDCVLAVVLYVVLRRAFTPKQSTISRVGTHL